VVIGENYDSDQEIGITHDNLYLALQVSPLGHGKRSPWDALAQIDHQGRRAIRQASARPVLAL